MAQGYHVNDNVLFQDNKSAMLLEKNGKASSTKRTKHINIRYFFITDRINQGEVSLEWCPTGDMIGDYMTKPLQGELFRTFRDQIMGVVPTKDPGPGKGKPATSNSSQPPSILRDKSNQANSVISKSVKFEDAPKKTNNSAPKRTSSSLVPKGNHRSVL